MITKIKQKVSNFFLYGVIFSLAAFVSSFFTEGWYSIKPPIAQADIPQVTPYYSDGGGAVKGDGSDGGDGGDGGGDGSDGSCDGSDSAGSDSCGF